MLNWGELIASTGIWKGLLQEVLPLCSTVNPRLFFVDLSDCSSRSKDETLAALGLLREFSRYGQLVLSLNKNECRTIYQHLSEESDASDDMKAMGEKIFRQLQPGILVIHQRNTAMAFHKNEFAQQNSCIVEQPAVLTGAGDHFNAGFCAAQLMGCCLQDSIAIAHLLAACYIKTGESPGWEILLETIATM